MSTGPSTQLVEEPYEEGGAARAAEAIAGRRPRASNGRATLRSVKRAPAGASWDERCAALFEDLRKPARVMVHRAFGRAFSPEEVEDVYSNAWASTLAALRGRERSMSDDELRSYLLTAVANHASKEMRRRSRKPTGALEDAHAQLLSDPHQLSPEERAGGSETGSQARDVLASLPPRRRAVMLLRYGWGLEPKEVCRLVDGLSPRAYRKEITRGVEQMIERFRRIERGDWCESREPLIRDYVAGTADEDVRRQAVEHISHCRSCGRLVARLNEGLHELGGGPLAWTAIAGALGERGSSIGERLAGLFERGREGAASLSPAAGEASAGASGSALATGARGAGAAGAGLLAKLTGAGLAGKLAIACVGAGAIGVACVTGGVVPEPAGIGEEGRPARISVDTGRVAGTIAVVAEAAGAERTAERTADRIAAIEQRVRERRRERRAEQREAAAEAEEAGALDGSTDYAGAPASSPAPTASASEQEFGLPSTTAPTSSSPGPGDSGASAGDVASEFGP